jgi:transposase
LQGINASLQKARRKLEQLQHSLRRRQQGQVRLGKAPTVPTVTRQVEQILSGQFMKSLLQYRVEAGPVPTLTYRTNTAAFSRLIKTHLGKTILFTDNDSWSNEEIVAGYRSQSQIESAFRDMKNPHFLGWSPMYHWTDSKIRVHAFYCVLGLTLTSLLRRALHQQGIDLSMARMLELLGDIEELLLIYPKRPGEAQPYIVSCLSERDAEQQQLLDRLNLGRYTRV